MKKIGILIVLIGIAFTTRSQSECEKNYAIYFKFYLLLESFLPYVKKVSIFLIVI